MEPRASTREPVSVIVAVAVRLYRDGLTAALNGQDHVRVAASAGTPVEIQAAVRQLQPDVIVLDVALEDVRMLMSALRAESSRSHILAFAVRDDINSILDYAEAGAEGFFTVNGSVAELVEAIERTAAGELMCSPRLAAQLLRRAAHHQETPTADDTASPLLSGRQLQVLSLLQEGRTNKEIATALHIAEATAKNHVHQVLQKLQVTSRTMAVAVSASRLTVRSLKRTSSRLAS
jgi:DNA-binding NarL/FixJ family response regulator